MAAARIRGHWRLAATLSIVPGLGQLYNSEPLKAAVFFIGTALTIAPAVGILMWGEALGHQLLERQSFVGFLLMAWGSVIVFLALFIGGLFLWGSAMVDAALQARDGRAEPRWRFFHL